MENAKVEFSLEQFEAEVSKLVEGRNDVEYFYVKFVKWSNHDHNDFEATVYFKDSITASGGGKTPEAALSSLKAHLDKTRHHLTAKATQP